MNTHVPKHGTTMCSHTHSFASMHLHTLFCLHTHMLHTKPHIRSCSHMNTGAHTCIHLHTHITRSQSHTLMHSTCVNTHFGIRASSQYTIKELHTHMFMHMCEHTFIHTYTSSRSHGLTLMHTCRILHTLWCSHLCTAY